jgi:hypothetical protein
MAPPPAVESDARVGALERPLAGILARPEAAAASALAVVASLVFLLARLIPDVSGKPLFDDEVLAGLTALHPLGELVDIVLWDRGGAPLHFVLAHAALAIDASPEALRWLSVVFALATVPVCFDLGRRLGGHLAGSIAAVVAATSSMLAVYGTIGRMYALFAFASALAVDLFVRALERPSRGAIVVAAIAAWLLPAVHPYGIVVVGIEAAVALVLWRGRGSWRTAAPVLALGLALTPFVLADLRLSERFGVGAFERESVAPPDFAMEQLGEALAAFAGGAGALALGFFALAIAGLFVVFRRSPAFGAFALLALAAIPLLLVVAKADDDLMHLLSPRHLMYGLPVWAALVGVGTARAVRDLPRVAAVACVAAVAAAAVLAPTGISDPRTEGNAAEAWLAPPAQWVRAEAPAGSVLFPYSPVYLAALPDTREATPIPRSGRPLAMVRRADYPVPAVVVALPLHGTRVDRPRLIAGLGPRSEAAVFHEWLVLKVPGPYATDLDVLVAARKALVDVRRTTHERAFPFRRELRGTLVTVCGALAELGEPCPRRVLPPHRRP